MGIRWELQIFGLICVNSIEVICMCIIHSFMVVQKITGLHKSQEVIMYMLSPSCSLNTTSVSAGFNYFNKVFKLVLPPRKLTWELQFSVGDTVHLQMVGFMIRRACKSTDFDTFSSYIFIIIYLFTCIYIYICVCVCMYVYGCFLKWWYLQNTPK